MRKKFTMLLASMFLCMGAWAQTTVTTVSTGKWYQLKCTATDAAHGNGNNVWFADLGTTFAGKSTTATYFYFMPASEGKYYIYSATTNQVVNVDGTALVHGDAANTEWTIGTINDEGYVYISSSDYNYLNNAAGSGGNNNIQIKNHPSGVTANNPCSLWYLCEYSSRDIQLGTIAADGSLNTTWATTTWVAPFDIPTDVAAVEATQYPSNETNIQTVSMAITAPAGDLAATLTFTGGSNRLDILGVDLLSLNENGDVVDVVDTDYHFGYSGSNKENNTYIVEVPSEGTYAIRYWVTFCQEANTSAGNITLTHMSVLPISSAAELSNDKVYTVTPSNTASTGAWDVDANATMLSLTIYTDGIDATDANQQFAFLTVNEETYLYSYGAKKFVADDNAGQKLTDELSALCLTTFEASTIADKLAYPMVVAVGGAHLCATNQDHFKQYGGIVTNWNHTGDAGNAVAIVPVDGTVDLSEAVAKIETYQIAREKAALNTLITEAQELAAKDYINSTVLEAAIATAQDVADDESATYATLTEQVTALTEAITAAGYVTTVEGFSNNAVYTFVSNRSATSYLMYNGTNDFVASPFKETELTAGAEVANCQWAVYKSTNGYYYMYNLGAQKFMGTESAANTGIPFSETPQTTDLKFKVSAVATHPIMISSNGGNGAVNQSNEGSFTNNHGVVNWSGGFGATNDPGNVHKVTIVGALDSETLTTIENLVNSVEPKFMAQKTLGETLTKFKTDYYDVWSSNAYKWRDQSGVNNYSLPDGSKTLEEYYNEAKAVYDDSESTLDAINAQITTLQGVYENITINLPEDGKFYHLRCTDGMKRLQSTVNASSRLTLSDNTNAESIFLYSEGALLSYTTGLYMDHRVFNTVGTTSDVIFSEATNGSRGCYVIKVGDNYIYGAGDNLDSGTSPDNRNGYNWWLEEVTTLPVTVSAAGYATLYAPVALTIPADVTVYTATVNGEYLTLNEVEGAIPANTGVLIEAAEDTYDFTVATEAAAIEGSNAFTGALAKSAKNAAAKVYTLQKPGETVGFYLFKGYTDEADQENTKTYINGFRAWVELPLDATVQGLRITRGDDAEDTTGIESTVNGQQATVIYDLAGRRVEKMEKGIYIVNGRKVVIK